jgi:large subunit ribosomal protein L3
VTLGLWGKKIGNTQVFDAGEVHHIVIVRVAPMDVIGLRQEGKHTLMQVAYGDYVRANKAMSGHFKSAGVKPRRHIIEFSIDGSLADRHPVGSQISAQALEGVTTVDVLGVTKGHGFTGPVKRHGFSMQPATHGNSLSHRAHGSTGQCQDPGRVFKGKKMAGQQGAVRRTVQNLSVHKVDINEGLVWIQGAIPGPVGAYVLMTPSFKKHQFLAAPIEAISDDEVSKGTEIDASQPASDEKVKKDTEAAAPQPAADEKVKKDTEVAAPHPATDTEVKEDREASDGN